MDSLNVFDNKSQELKYKLLSEWLEAGKNNENHMFMSMNDWIGVCETVQALENFKRKRSMERETDRIRTRILICITRPWRGPTEREEYFYAFQYENI